MMYSSAPGGDGDWCGTGAAAVRQITARTLSAVLTGMLRLLWECGARISSFSLERNFTKRNEPFVNLVTHVARAIVVSSGSRFGTDNQDLNMWRKFLLVCIAGALHVSWTDANAVTRSGSSAILQTTTRAVESTAERRVALVIGNSDSAATPPGSATNDARSMGALL